MRSLSAKQRKSYNGFLKKHEGYVEKGNRANTLHGILLIVLFSFAAFYIAGFPLVKKLSFSPLIVGIVLGMLYANSLRNKLPETWVPGIRFCTKQVLRWGIILYGFRLTLSEVAAVGIPASRSTWSS